jgi:hypothetical protein
MGRVLNEEDFTSGARNAVVSFDMWRTLLARNPQPVGQTIVLNRQAWTIVGVMPPGFAPPCHDTGHAAQAWIPLHRLHVKIDPAIVTMLMVVESHSVLLLRESAQLPCVKPTDSR